ncbi:MAG TPA: hypothetical protein VFD33_01220 [Bacillota bacterium]|nr:hypothetical protein [Bacillota bacterium]
MGVVGVKCVSCARRLGLFKTIFSGPVARCNLCRVKIKPLLLEYEGLLNDFSQGRYLSAGADLALKELRATRTLRGPDVQRLDSIYGNLKKETRLKNIKLFEDGLYKAGEYEDISADEYTMLEELKEKLDLSEDEIAQTNRYLFYLTNLSLLEEGVLPTVDNPTLKLEKREVCYYRTFARMLVKKKKGQRKAKSQGIRIRLIRSARFKYGKSKGTRIVDDYTSVADNGYLYLTNKRIVFVGANKTLVYPIKRLRTFVKYTDCVQFLKKKDKGNTYFLLEDQFAIDEFGASLLAVVKGTY